MCVWTPILDLSSSLYLSFPFVLLALLIPSLSPLLPLFCFQSVLFTFSSVNPFHCLSVAPLFLFHPSLSSSSSLTLVNAV